MKIEITEDIFSRGTVRIKSVGGSTMLEFVEAEDTPVVSSDVDLPAVVVKSFAGTLVFYVKGIEGSDDAVAEVRKIVPWRDMDEADILHSVHKISPLTWEVSLQCAEFGHYVTPTPADAAFDETSALDSYRQLVGGDG